MKTFTKFTALFGTQFLGVLNDNLLKNLIVFLGAAMFAADRATVSATAAILLILPYVLFSKLAAQLAIKYSRSQVVKWAKMVEIPIMALASAGIFFESLPVLYTALFGMGLQSALYSPSKYGLIKDLGGDNKISFGNGIMEMISFVGILLGTLLGSLIANDYANNSEAVKIWASISLLILSIAGYFASSRIPESDKQTSIVECIKPWKQIFSNQPMFLNILGNCAFWFVASLIHLTTLQYCPETLLLTSSQTGMILGTIAIGIALGCFVAGLLSKDRVELGLVTFGLFGMVFCLLPIAVGPTSTLSFTLSLTGAAFFSGFWKVALNANLQKYTPSPELNSVLSKNNQAVFITIIFSSLIYFFGQNIIAITGIFTLVWIVIFILFSIAIRLLLPQTIRLIVFLLGRIIFKHKIIGKTNIPTKGGALLVSNHVSLLDSLLIVLAIPRNVRFVMVESILPPYDALVF